MDPARASAHPGAPPSPSVVRRLLICRPNSRLGNTVLLTPLVQEIEATLPAARIDILTACADAAAIFRSFDGVRTLYCLPVRGARHPLGHLGTYLRARRERYDLVIDPCPTSWSSRFAARLMRGQVKVGFASAFKSRGADISVPFDGAPAHMGGFGVYLLRRAVLGMEPEQARSVAPKPSIRLTALERRAGERTLAELSGAGPSTLTLAIAAAATGAKRYDGGWWQRMLEALTRMLPSVSIIEIRPPSGVAAFPQYPGYSSSDVRRVAAVINAAHGFVCPDSGLMHLGAASDTPTFGLFKVTAPAMYTPYGGASAAIEASDDEPVRAATQITAHLTQLPARVSGT